MDRVSKQKITRFPRLTTSVQAKAFAQLLWGVPEIQIRFRRKTPATQFIFTIPVPSEFRKAHAVYYRMIFDYFDWETAIREAYDKDIYGGKQISDYISLGLHKAFIGAVKRWREMVRTLVHASEGVTDAMLDALILGEFSGNPKGKTGPQPNPYTSLRAVERFDQLRSRVADLRRAFKRRTDPAKDKDLAVALEKIAPWEIIRKALKEIFNDEGRIKPRQFLTPEISNHEIASTIARVGLTQEGHDFSSVSFRSHVRFGKELRQALSGDPTAIATKAARHQ